MTPQDKEEITRWGKEITQELRIKVAPDANGHLSTFCDELKQIVPAIRIKNEDEAMVTPAIIAADNIAYQAIPEGKEIPPFLAALSSADISGNNLNTDLKECLDNIQLPAMIKVYMSPQCPFCPQVVSLLVNMAQLCSNLYVTVIDAALFPEHAEKDKVKSVPTTILDDSFRWTGVFEPLELVDMCLSRDPARLSADSLQRIIESGDAPQLAVQMTEAGKIFPAIIDLLAHDKWPVRLGAMVAVEYLADDSPEIAAELEMPLWDIFWEMPETTQGDLVQVLSLLDTPGIREKLCHILEKSHNEEVREAVRDALEEKGWAC